MSIQTPATNVFATAAVVGVLQSVDDDVSTLSNFHTVVVVVGVVAEFRDGFSTSTLLKFSLSSLLLGRSLLSSTGSCFSSTSQRSFFAGSCNDDVSSLSSSSVRVDARARRWPDGESFTDDTRERGGAKDEDDTPGTIDGRAAGDGSGFTLVGSFNHLCSKHSAAVIRSLHMPHHRSNHLNTTAPCDSP